MKTKISLHRYFWMIFIFLLVSACSPNKTTIVPTQVDTTAVYKKAFTTTIAGMTQTAAPTLTRTHLPTRTPLPLLQIEGLHVAYTLDNNLYLQNSGKQPVQLTHSGQDHNPIFSDDGEIIVFDREKIDPNHNTLFLSSSGNNIYYFDVSTGQEQPLIPNDWLTALGTGTKTGYLTFVPHTHQLLFITHPDPCKSYLLNPAYAPICEINLYIVDTDTAKIKGPIASGLKGDLRISPFSVSPNSKLLTIASREHIDLFSIDGNILRPNIMTYPTSNNFAIFPRQFWLPDSSGLVIALPVDSSSDPTVPINYTVWHYRLDQNKVTQTVLEPHLMEYGCEILVSPDRNWVAYEISGAALYLANLPSEKTQKYTSGPCLISWSPGSKYFIYTDHDDNVFLGTLGEAPTSIGPRDFLGWVKRLLLSAHVIF